MMKTEMIDNVTLALEQFTQKFVTQWQKTTGHEPVSGELYDIASPCIIKTERERVFWQPLRQQTHHRLDGVERAMEISVHSDVHLYYCYQYAGDMSASFGDLALSLLQVWSEDDFVRLQENLIGHLFTQKRLKLSPTLFIATVDSELEIISVCNRSGEVILETFGSQKRTVLASSLTEFLNKLEVVINFSWQCNN